MKWHLFAYLAPFSVQKYASEYKLCKNCIHHRFDSYNMSVCSLFGQVNLINGKIKYESCNVLRSVDCGIDGIYYQRYIPFTDKNIQE
jgi:hypothetical protein